MTTLNLVPDLEKNAKISPEERASNPQATAREPRMNPDWSLPKFQAEPKNNRRILQKGTPVI